jgi:hypothetical protein
MGSTSIADGAGTAMAQAIVVDAAAQGLAIGLEPASEGAAAFWTKVGMKEDPFGTGFGMGLTAADTKALAKVVG